MKNESKTVLLPQATSVSVGALVFTPNEGHAVELSDDRKACVIRQVCYTNDITVESSDDSKACIHSNMLIGCSGVYTLDQPNSIPWHESEHVRHLYSCICTTTGKVVNNMHQYFEYKYVSTV